ncbi:hypothetical protein PYW08_001870 [Mythimna loreyi]|uniref:Uncharacterized protein n=1 Tax=Mythimna loreyi TaxID=667449 RepID=A0ACC2R7D5_9NEOP|nr:hypothetical protein PYW08_001870 [Mythimna loreyi]
MKVIEFLLLIAVCNGLPVDIPKAPQLLLPIPNINRLAIKGDPNHITHHAIVIWNKVDSGDPGNPIIGYKLKVWEIPKIKRTVYKTQGGKVVRVLEESFPELYIYTNEIPNGVPKEIVTQTDETAATIREMYDDVLYQLAVQAFTAEGDGPLSVPVRVRFGKSKDRTKEDLLGKKETVYK